MAETVVPDQTDYWKAQKIMNFGKYLQTHELAQPLTWHVLDQAAAEVPSRKLAAKDVRGCLSTVGHLLANAGKIESRKDYRARRKLSLRIANAPSDLKPLLQAFAEWNLRRKTTCWQVIAQVETISALFRWCMDIGITSLESINQHCIEQYFLTTYWELQCPCGAAFPITLQPGMPASSCTCGNQSQMVKVAKVASGTIRGARGRLAVFFDWAVLRGVISDNPVQIQVANPKQQIQHYPAEILKPLFDFIRSPESDPAQALVLSVTRSDARKRT